MRILFHIVSTNHIHFYEVLFLSIKEEISFSVVYGLFIKFLSWVLVYRSDDGPRNRPKLVAFVINCVLHDGTLLDTFIVLSTTGMCHVTIPKEFNFQQPHSENH